MSYKQALLSILERFLRKKFSYEEIKEAYGNWNVKESKEQRDLFIEHHLEDLHELVTLTHKYHTNQITELELKTELTKLYTKR